ncbi:Tripartite motif-containing protein 2-like [Oopsacas minuta]|uniref:Tripartite motif-containing protein 2-like n=1 Tax=Oopsacas minuta TaxID=111878 RepID=A0AAV7KAR2_9METZ|nr:Tripartite motif-containing protein 2-like [Oopsacas minuta]
MRELENKLDTTRNGMKEVELVWDGKLEGLLNSTGCIRVRGLPDYRVKFNPTLLVGKHKEKFSTTSGEFQYPRAIAIHSETNNIYICDCGNNRVQVFNESLEFLFKISSQMKSPAGICINLDRVYVTQSIIHCLAVYSIRGIFIASAGREGRKELEFAYPKGVAVSTQNNILYICDWLNNRIQCLNTDLSFNSFICDVPLPKDIKVTSRDILVLTGGDPCIRIYDHSHVLSREIIPCGGQLSESGYFCLDTESNIIISAQCVLIYSYRGELIHKFGKFNNLRGIGLDSNCRIVAVSEDTNSCVHLF